MNGKDWKAKQFTRTWESLIWLHCTKHILRCWTHFMQLMILRNAVSQETRIAFTLYNPKKHFMFFCSLTCSILFHSRNMQEFFLLFLRDCFSFLLFHPRTWKYKVEIRSGMRKLFALATVVHCVFKNAAVNSEIDNEKCAFCSFMSNMNHFWVRGGIVAGLCHDSNSKRDFLFMRWNPAAHHSWMNFLCVRLTFCELCYHVLCWA